MDSDATSIVPAGYDPTAPDANRHDYAVAMLAEARTHYNSAERFVVLMATIKAEQLYKVLGYRTFDGLVLKEFGSSKRTASRWVEQGKALATGEGAQKAIGPGGSGPRVSQNDEVIGVERPGQSARISQREAAQLAREKREAAKPAPPAEVPQPAEPATPGAEPPSRRPRGPRQVPTEPKVSPEVAVASEEIPAEGWEYPTAPASVPDSNRAGLTRLLGLMGSCDAEVLAGVATKSEAQVIVEFAAHFVPVARKGAIASAVAVTGSKASRVTRRSSSDDDVDPKDCKHPVTRRIGTNCGACGATGLR